MRRTLNDYLPGKTARLGAGASLLVVMACAPEKHASPSTAMPSVAPADALAPADSASAAASATTLATATAIATASRMSALPAPPRSHKGAFIWEFGKNAPAPAAAAELLAKWGYGRVFIKSSEGAGGVHVADPTDPKQPTIASPPAMR